MLSFTKLFVVVSLTIGSVFLQACSSKENENAAGTKMPAASEHSNEPIKIKVSTNFEPKSIEVNKGKPVKLAFYRENDENCGGEVVFAKLNIRKELPVGETVIVEFTPDEAGEISFTCGMDMMRGKILVQ